jgi:site-specific DNA-methyltransferase (adenine-specific)
MPKRPPRKPVPLAVPEALTGVTTPHCARRAGEGELWWADVGQLLAGIPDGSVRLVVADPPYAIAKAEWDEFESLEHYVDWCDAWIREVHRVLVPDGTAYICGFSEILAEVKARSARRFAGGCRWLVWSYRNKANLGSDWGRSHESILHLRKGKKFVMNVDEVRVPYNAHTTKYPERTQAVSSAFSQQRPAARHDWQPHPLGAKPRDVLDVPILCNGMGEKTEHPTQKPEELIEKLVRASSNPGELVVDPFCGSGTTLVVAARHGRRYLGGDADARYVGLAAERLAGRKESAA